MAVKSASLKKIINLLPSEIIAAEREYARQSFVKRISLTVVAVFVTLAFLILAIRLFFNIQVQAESKRETQALSQVSSLKDRESLVVLLKQRLSQISILSTTPTKPTEAFNLITSLTPAGAKVVQLTIDSVNKISLNGEASDVYALQVFLDNLTSSSKNQGKILSAHLDGLNQTQDNRIHFELTILLK